MRAVSQTWPDEYDIGDRVRRHAGSGVTIVDGDRTVASFTVPSELIAKATAEILNAFFDAGAPHEMHRWAQMMSRRGRVIGAQVSGTDTDTSRTVGDRPAETEGTHMRSSTTDRRQAPRREPDRLVHYAREALTGAAMAWATATTPHEIVATRKKLEEVAAGYAEAVAMTEAATAQT